MENNKDSDIMITVSGHVSASPEHITLDYDYACSDWRISSQRAADLYGSGTKLWTKENLEDIEHQLSQSSTKDKFSVRRIDGKIVQILNPMFQIQNPIWKPHVKYQGYWQLVNSQPDGPVETYLCSYIVDWTNRTERDFRAHIAKPMQEFDEKEVLWQNSTSCKSLMSQVQDLLGTTTVKKVLCFGLGDFCRSAPDWLKLQHGSWNETLDVEELEGCMIQHAMALSIAELCRGNGTVPLLLAQDPDYTDVAADILTKKGFKIVGPCGAGGFAEIDEDSIVISAFVSAPLKQIIADLARPPLIISSELHTHALNKKSKPFADAESPRTRQMYLDYDSHSLPSHPDEKTVSSALNGLYLHRRNQKPVEPGVCREAECA